MAASEVISVSTKGNTDIINITDRASRAVAKSGLKDGVLTLFVKGSTASISTIEYEPNLVKDLRDALERLVPSDTEYAHTKTWGDFNGHSHVRATLMGPSVAIPFAGKKLLLGTWQQIILIDFDTHPRQREVFLHLTGK